MRPFRYGTLLNYCVGDNLYLKRLEKMNGSFRHHFNCCLFRRGTFTAASLPQKCINRQLPCPLPPNGAIACIKEYYCLQNALITTPSLLGKFKAIMMNACSYLMSLLLHVCAVHSVGSILAISICLVTTFNPKSNIRKVYF